jgi:biotin carboxylase
MKSVIFIETNRYGSSMDGILVARKNDYYIHLITAKKQFLEERTLEVNEVHYITDPKEENIQEKIEEINKKHRVNFIVSFIDSYVSIAAKMNRIYCQIEISDEILSIMENKLYSRKFFQNMDYSPYYFTYKYNDSIEKLLNKIKGKYPLVLKAPSSAGSKDVYLIGNETQMNNRIKHLKRKYSNEEFLIEEYLIGPQYIVEAIVYQGDIQIVAVIQQKITKKYKFIVTGYSISPNEDEEIYEGITSITRCILKEIGLMNGNCHLELRLVNGNWKLIEINPRISGGAMNRIINEAYGFSYAEQILTLYKGDKPNIQRKYENNIYAHFFTVDKIGKLLKVIGLEEAGKHSGIIDIYIKPKVGQILSPPLSMGHRYGYVIARGKTIEEAKNNALRAAEQIIFQMSPIQH